MALLELRQIGNPRTRRFVVHHTEDLAIDIHDGHEVGVVGDLDILPGGFACQPVVHHKMALIIQCSAARTYRRGSIGVCFEFVDIRAVLCDDSSTDCLCLKVHVSARTTS